MTTNTPKATRREWIGLAVLALPAMLIALDASILYLAIPNLVADLNPSSSQLLWILDIYGFLIAGFLITMGTLGDRIGRRLLLMLGAGAFGLASVLAAYSTSAEMLIATRALLGIAGATLMPSTLALIRNMFHHAAERTTAIGIWMSSFMVGMTIGPLAGGALLENFWWGSAFLLAVPAMVLLLIAGPLLLPEYRDPKPGKLDIPSVLLSLVAVIATIYGIKELAKQSWETWPLVSLIAGLALAAVFVHRQRTLTDPLIDLRLFANRKFGASLGALTLTLFALSGLLLFLAQYLQLVLGLSPFEAGLWTLPQAVAMSVASIVVPALARKIRPAYFIAGGLLIAITGFLMFTHVESGRDLGLIAGGMALFSIGMGPVMILGTDMIVGAVPPERAGAASALSETNQEFGLAIGVAVLGSVGTAVYRANLSDAMPADVPDNVATAANDTLGMALAAEGELPGDLGTELAEAARYAFTEALHINAVISAALVGAAAVLALVLLRHVPPSGSSASGSTESIAAEENELAETQVR